jgi:hypothetical protein
MTELTRFEIRGSPVIEYERRKGIKRLENLLVSLINWPNIQLNVLKGILAQICIRVFRTKRKRLNRIRWKSAVHEKAQ